MTTGTSDEVARIAELEAQCEVLCSECERLRRQRDEARAVADEWEEGDDLPATRWES